MMTTTTYVKKFVIAGAAVLALCVGWMAGGVGATVATAASATSTGANAELRTPAWFEDHWIDLSVSWEDAGACDIGGVSDVTIVCFRDERALDDALAAHRDMAFAITSVCSSSLRLYADASYSGAVLSLSTRSATLSLSNYSFDNVTSSYKVGACDAEFWEGSGGTGSAYPGNTTAGAQSATMVTGWDNRISSVLIY